MYFTLRYITMRSLHVLVIDIIVTHIWDLLVARQFSRGCLVRHQGAWKSLSWRKWRSDFCYSDKFQRWQTWFPLQRKRKLGFATYLSWKEWTEMVNLDRCDRQVLSLCLSGREEEGRIWHVYHIWILKKIRGQKEMNTAKYKGDKMWASAPKQR